MFWDSQNIQSKEIAKIELDSKMQSHRLERNCKAFEMNLKVAIP
jgi:hypothetical protein